MPEVAVKQPSLSKIYSPASVPVNVIFFAVIDSMSPSSVTSLNESVTSTLFKL